MTDVSKSFGSAAWKGAEKVAVGMERVADAAFAGGTKMANAKPRQRKVVRAVGRGVRNASQYGVASTLGAGVVAGGATAGTVAVRRHQGIAKRVHDDIMRMDFESAKIYAQMVLVGALQHDLETHTDLLQTQVDRVLAKRATTIQKRLATSIAKGGGDSLVQVAALISKAGFTNLTDDQRRRLAAQQDRDASGRFKSMHRKITYSTTVPLSGRVAMRQGIPAGTHDMSRADRARYQQAWRQVSDMVGQFQDAPAGSATLHLVYKEPDGSLKHELGTLDADKFAPSAKGLPKGGSHPIDPKRFKGNARLLDAQVVVDGGLTAQGAAFNLVGALAGPQVAGRTAAGLGQDEHGKFTGAEGLKSFADDWDAQLEGDINNPANRVFRRVGHGSRLLQDIAGDNIPSQAKLALKTAEAVGAYGPEAQKVIGPHADRAAYRYRGVERKPDAGLQGAVASYSRRFGAEDGRKALIYGRQEEVATRGGTRLDFQQSPIVGYFQGRLADKDLIHLQRKSGVIPPSEGVIIDRKGNVVTQAVGYGDDWYLPFNLKTLSKLKGGDYIRTRTWGGVTTEDIYAGLMSGARSVTVVSHNGVYTVEFDPAFKGKRRYNDKAGRMVKRYGHLLDAVKSKDVTLSDIPQDRMLELREEAAIEGDPRGDRTERERFAAALKQKMADERQEPTLSRAARRQLAEDFLNDKASHLQTSDGSTATWDKLAHGYVARNVAAERQVFEQQMGSPDEIARMRALGVGVANFDEEQAKRAAMGRVSDPEAAIVALGYEKDWASTLENAEADYRESLSPLRLDGAGYDKALKALKEQFPYYIANVSWQPTLRGGTDHGYVKPRFNRPEGALAGYYDPTILGGGKVSADRTRNQNRGVKGVRPVAQVTETTDETAPPAQAAPSRPADRKAALKALHAEIADAKVFGPGSKAPGQPITAAFLEGNSPEAAALKMARRPWEDWLADMAEDPKEGDKLVQAGEVLRSVLGLSPAKVAAAKDPEKASRGVNWSLEMAADAPGKVFAFGDEYGPGRRPEQYDRVIERGLAHLKGELGANEDLDSFIARMNQLHTLADDPAATRVRVSDKPKYERLAREAAQVRQARRFKDEAEAKAKEVEALQSAEERRMMLDRDVTFQVDSPETAQTVLGEITHRRDER